MPDPPLTLARRSLLGLAVGDAFGEAMSGKSAASADRAVHRVLPSPRPWPWTDDTAMASSVVEILARHGHIDPDALIAAFVRRWKEEPLRGYGRGAVRLLTLVNQGADWRKEAAGLFHGTGSYGNGAAMRAAPIGAWFWHDLDRVRVEAVRSAETTHAHPDGAAGAVAVAVAAALVTQGGALGSAFSDVIRLTPPGPTRDGLRRGADTDPGRDAASVGRELGTGLDAASHDTVPFALWVAARHPDNYEDALWTATAQPGDRDTLGAIVGGIVVLATGEGGIPPAWRAATEGVPDPLT
jgi:ADP-ribosylglycohydrolase